MANKKEKEKQMQDRLQIILADLLKDDDNKYCVDCDSKGPRWASWTLGIFLCIRCAGIHRNLGVHLSRVKSVNLDSWTQQQVAMMKEIGNSRGRAIYEANLEDSFRRPQTDAALEQFIRAKYEHKRYIAKEWIPPTPTVEGIAEEIRKIEQNQNKKRINYNPSQNAPVNRKEIVDKTIITESKPQIIPNKVDLLGLENDSVTDNNIDDTFGDFVFAAQPTLTNNKSQPPPQLISSEENSSVSSAVNDLMGLNLGTDNLINNISGPSTITPNMSNSSASSVPNVGGKLDKSSILALYNNSSSNSNASNMMGQMPGSSAWPNSGGTTYQTNVMQSDLQLPGYGGGTNWMVSGQMGVPGPFGLQHNPFFNNSVFSGQPVMPISQPSLPASMAGNLSQPPNQVLW